MSEYLLIFPDEPELMASTGTSMAYSSVIPAESRSERILDALAAYNPALADDMVDEVMVLNLAPLREVTAVLIGMDISESSDAAVNTATPLATDPVPLVAEKLDASLSRLEPVDVAYD
jgi:hypothetical protein